MNTCECDYRLILVGQPFAWSSRYSLGICHECTMTKIQYCISMHITYAYAHKRTVIFDWPFVCSRLHLFLPSSVFNRPFVRSWLCIFYLPFGCKDESVRSSSLYKIKLQDFSPAESVKVKASEGCVQNKDLRSKIPMVQYAD